MKHYLSVLSVHIVRRFLALIVVAGSALALPALAAPVLLATAPLVTSSASSVAPNIMYMLDDSGSMDWDYMPDTAKNFAGKYGFNSAQCNGVAYNPSVTYTPPVKSDGTSYPNASFTAAQNDGFDSTSGTTNLSTSFPGGSGTGASGSTLATPQAAFYYKYTGAQTTPYKQNYYSTSSTFYQECNSSFGTVPGTSIGSSPGVSVFTFVKVTTTSGPGGTDERTNFANWFTYYSTRMMMMKTGVGQAFKGVNPSYRIGFMTMNNNVSPDFVDILPFAGGCTVGSGTCQRDQWYTKLYTANPGQSTPLRQTLSQIGNLYANKYNTTYTYTATVAFTCGGTCTSTSLSGITVGGVQLMNAASTGSTKTSTVGTNVSGQINTQNTVNPAIYYTSTASNGVVTIHGEIGDLGVMPVVTVASGNMTVKVTAFVSTAHTATLNGVTPLDPVQYSCQKNFVVLSTDGYWNGNAGYQLDGTTAIGNQDGNAARPYYDGATVNQITSQVSETQTQMAKGTKQTLQPYETSTSNLVKSTYDLQKSSYPLISSSYDLQQTAYPLISSSYDLQQTTYPLIKTSNPLQQTATPLIKTSNPLQQTTYPLIKTSNPLQQTTYPLIKTSNPLQQTATPLIKTSNPLQQTAYTLQAQTATVQQAVSGDGGSTWSGWSTVGSCTWDTTATGFATITVTGSSASNVTKITVGGVTITSGSYAGNASNTTEAAGVAALITAFGSGYSASASGNVITIKGPSTAVGRTVVVTKTSGSDTFTPAYMGQTKCQNGTLSAAAPVGSCTYNVNTGTSGTWAPESICSYSASPTVSTVASCTTVAASGTATNGSAWVAQTSCAYTTTGQTVTNPAASCTVVNSTGPAYSGPQVLCSYGAPVTTTVTSCSTSAQTGATTANGTVFNASAVSSCAYTTTGQTVTNPAASCTVVNSTASPYSGPQVLCSYGSAAAPTTVTSCNAVAKSTGSTNGTAYAAATDCAYTTTGQTVTNPAGSCTVTNSTGPAYSGPQVLCSYGSAAAPTTVTSCNAVAKSTGSTNGTAYAAATDCAYTTTGQTVTNPAGSCTVTNSTGPAYSGPQVLCSYGAPVVSTVTSCSTSAQTTGSTTGTVYNASAVTGCAYTTTGQTVTNPAGSCKVVNSTASPYSGPQVLCSYGSAAVSAVTSCSTVAKSTGSTDGTTYAAAADCAYATTPTVTNPAASCKIVNQSGSSPYSGPAVSCSYASPVVSAVTSCTTGAKTTATTNGTVYNASAASCAYSTTPVVTNPAASCKVVTQSAGPTNYTGPAVSCSYDTAAVSTATSCTTSAKTTATTNGTVYNASAVTCAYSTTPTVTNPATCTVVAQSAGPTNYTGPAVSCSWTAWTPYTATTSCNPAPQSGTYNMTATAGVATQCLTNTPVSACAAGTTCTTATTGGTTNYVTSTSGSFNCTAAAPTSTNSWMTTSCYPSTVFGPAYVATCAPALTDASASNGYVKTTCATTSNTVYNLTSCTGQVPTAANNYTTITCSAGSGGTSDTLADTAMYYYQTDLRDPSLGNCQGALGVGTDVCQNNVPISGTDTNVAQHVTTFTLGIGTRGQMVYSSTYKADTSGDYFSVAQGLKADSTKTPPICSWQTDGTTCNWPAPASNSYTNIDDLWHAAVNGRGSYFAATDPNTLANGLQSTLQAINQVTGAAAAAATSTLNPVTGNNYAYVASYTTVKWIGNLEQRTIDVTNGDVSTTASWCVENIAPPTCIAPNFIVTDTSGGSTVYYCAATAIDYNNDGVVDALDCTAPQVFDSATSTCRQPINTSCVGTLPPMVSTTTDTRTIYTANSGGTALIPFDASYAAANPTNFSAAHISGLSQWSTLTSAQQTAAAGVNLINYLRGQNGYEENRTNNAVSNWLYRDRIAVMGDALESQPTFIAAPTFSYSDPGYSSFVTAQASRTGTVYMGTNDGMLHAFRASDGVERWAFVPTQVIPNMWHLADFNYGAQHVNFINGSPVVSDICTANCTNASTAVWKTIVVGGLNAGGREYYALDITDPANPKLLWEFTPAKNANLGYSYGRPVVTKKQDGTWVVLVSSGYDNGTLSADNVTANSPAGDGMGHLFVLNAGTGSVISDISNLTGSAATPNGFAKFNAYSAVAGTNQAGLVYGGDLLGNVWRFDINTAVAPFKFATLADPSGTAQPITVSPTLGEVNGIDIIFVGTGKYLETADLSTNQKQTIYGLVDNNATVTLTNPAGSPRNSTTLIQQTLSAASNSVRTDTNNTVDLTSKRGWYVDLVDTGERANVDFQLVQGTLLVPTIVPSSVACSPGGYGYFNFFNYQTGGPPGTDNIVSQYYSSPIVGMNVLYIGGTPMVEIVTSNNPTPTPPPTQPPFKEASGGFTQTREVWRELIP